METSKATSSASHDDVIKLKHCPRNWPFVGGIHRSPVDSPKKRPVTRGLDIFCDQCLNKRVITQSRRWWFGMPSRSLWPPSNGTMNNGNCRYTRNPCWPTSEAVTCKWNQWFANTATTRLPKIYCQDGLFKQQRLHLFNATPCPITTCQWEIKFHVNDSFANAWWNCGAKIC